jgi:predicted dinucleotide-binding enzyme
VLPQWSWDGDVSGTGPDALIARHPAAGQGRRAGDEPEPNHGACQPAALDGFGESRKWIGSPDDQGGGEQRSPSSADPCAIGPCRPDRNDGLGRVVDLSMTTWGFIGSGNIGTTVARLAIAAGHDVVLSNSREPQTLADVVEDLGPYARAATAAEAAREGDVVVVTILLGDYQQVPAEELRDKIVIDTMNYYPQRDGNIAELDDESTTSSALLQAHLPDSRVVKGFNNIFFQHLAALPRVTGAHDRSALPIAGDDPVAKKVVAELLDQIGYDTVDLGSLWQGWRTQPDTAAYGLMYAVNPQAWDQGARPASATEVAKRVAEVAASPRRMSRVDAQRPARVTAESTERHDQG